MKSKKLNTIDKSIETKLIREGKRCEFDFSPLIAFMKDSGITFYDRRINRAYGLGTYFGVYLDMDMIVKYFNPIMVSYIILHEIGHYKRIIKMGKKTMLERLSLEDFTEFSDHVIEEEIYADRYASYVFYNLNKTLFPIDGTQQLHIPRKKEIYRSKCTPLFGVVNYNEDNYKELVESFLC